VYEGWHIALTAHVRARMRERLVDEAEVREVIAQPDSVEVHSRHSRLLTKYLPEWDRILVVAVEEHGRESMVLVKTVLWSKAN